MSEEILDTDGTFLQKVVIQLYGFMKMAGLKCSFVKDSKELLCYVFSVTDLTEEGNPIGFDIRIKPSTLEGLQDDPVSIEEFCSMITRNTGNQLFNAKVDLLLKYKEQSKLIVPK